MNLEGLQDRHRKLTLECHHMLFRSEVLIGASALCLHRSTLVIHHFVERYEARDPEPKTISQTLSVLA